MTNPIDILDHFPEPLKGKKMLVGVSGGVDSTVLAHVLHRKGWDFDIAHVNYKLRGANSKADEAFVRELGQQLGVQVLIYTPSDDGLSKPAELSLQDWARKIRMKWFMRLVFDEKSPYSCVMLAHHQDDQAETILLNLMRSSGIHGVRGMRVGNSYLRRPFLSFSREQILDWANKHGVTWREDRSNQKLIYRRNVIRHKVLPELEKMQQGAAKSLARSAKFLGENEKIYNWALEQMYAACVTEDDGKVYIDVARLERFPAPITILHEWLEPFGFHVYDREEIWNNRHGQPGATWKSLVRHNVQLTRDRGKLIISSEETGESLQEFKISKFDEVLSVPVTLTFQHKLAGEVELQKDEQMAFLDADRLTFPLTLRNWKPGDRFTPLGMPGQTQKVSDFLINKKVALPDKANVWVLTSGDEIVWVVGRRISEEFKMTNQTKKVWIAGPNT